MKKTFLLCALNAKFTHSSLAAHSLCCAAKNYSKIYNLKEPEILIQEFSINDRLDNIIYHILNLKPDVIAFSVYIWNVDYVAKIVKQIRKINKEIKIILGGPEVSYGIEHTSFEMKDFDYIISGEGERAFFCLTNLLEQKSYTPPMEWKFKIENKIVSCKLIEKLDEIPFVYSPENINKFDNRIIYYESSRGCPFKCSYCLSSVCGKVRNLSMQRIKSDLMFFTRNKVEQVKFVDRTFNCDSKKALEIWKFIIDNSENCDTNFHFEVGADLFTVEQIEILKTAKDGLIQFEMGIQSTKAETLKESVRVADNQKVFRNTLEILSQGNINVHVDLIVGLAYENFEDFKKSFNETYSLGAHQLQIGFLKLLSGAPMNETIQKHEFVFSDFNPYEIIKNKYISYSDILHLKKFEDCFEKVYNSQRFTHTLKELVKKFETPFDMYEKLTLFIDEKDLTFQSISGKNLFNLLYDFYKEKIGNNGLDEIGKNLLFDFYTCEKSEVIPLTLKKYVPLNKQVNALTKTILHQKNLHKEKSVAIRYIYDTAYIIDYRKKHPVTGKYAVIEVLSVDIER